MTMKNIALGEFVEIRSFISSHIFGVKKLQITEHFRHEIGYFFCLIFDSTLFRGCVSFKSMNMSTFILWSRSAANSVLETWEMCFLLSLHLLSIYPSNCQLISLSNYVYLPFVLYHLYTGKMTYVHMLLMKNMSHIRHTYEKYHICNVCFYNMFPDVKTFIFHMKITLHMNYICYTYMALM